MLGDRKRLRVIWRLSEVSVRRNRGRRKMNMAGSCEAEGRGVRDPIEIRKCLVVR